MELVGEEEESQNPRAQRDRPFKYADVSSRNWDMLMIYIKNLYLTSGLYNDLGKRYGFLTGTAQQMPARGSNCHGG